MVRRWILVLLLTGMSIILISDEESRTYIEKLRDQYAVDACDFSGWLSVEETSLYLPIFGLDSPIYIGEDYLEKITHRGWLELEFRDEKPYMAILRSIDGTGCGIYSEGYERAIWEALNKADKENAVVLAADGEQFIADIEDRLVMVSGDEYWLSNYELKTVAELNQAVEKVVEMNRKKDPYGQLIGGVISIREVLYADEYEISNSNLDETHITETNEIKYEANDFELKDYDKESFLEMYSEIYPEISSMFNYIEAEDNTLKVVYESKSELVFSFNVDFTYDESFQKVEAYDLEMLDTYNTSLGGSFNMSDEGHINYHYWIIENADFELTIVYVNNSEKFINDCTDNNMENIGEDNLVVQIVKKHN